LRYAIGSSVVFGSVVESGRIIGAFVGGDKEKLSREGRKAGLKREGASGR
jgi:hypothetical protein